MNLSPRTKNSIVVAVIIIIAVIVYFYYEGSPSSSSASSSLLTASSNSSVGSTELSLLNQVQSLSIDPSIFKDPAYQTLVDYTVPIPEEGVGRPNPFAPITGTQALVTPSPAAGAASRAAASRPPAAH